MIRVEGSVFDSISCLGEGVGEGGIMEKMLNINGKWNTMIEELWNLIVIDYSLVKKK